MTNYIGAGVTKEPTDPTPRPTELIKQYLQQHLEIYRELAELQKQVCLRITTLCSVLSAGFSSYFESTHVPSQGWESKEADAYFQKLQQSADNANSKGRARFFKLMRYIGAQLNAVTSALNIKPAQSQVPAILDLCMAPGGFSMAALDRNHNASLRGISLPQSQGGHEILIPDWETDSRIEIDFRDITMLAVEMGISDLSEILPSHPDAPAFSSDRPFQGMEFDIVLCDGQVLRTHPRHSYRENCEALRLLTSQLVLALQRVRPDGTVVILLHRVDSWRSVALLHMFEAFADIRLFKPRNGHAMRTSFYLVAKHVQPRCAAAQKAVVVWKEQWKAATFGGGGGGDEAPDSASDDTVNAVLDEFGWRLSKLARPVFAIQAEALRNAPFMKKILVEETAEIMR